MNITKATRWRVFAGVWIQSLFTSATAFFSLFCLPLCNQFGWSASDFSMAYTICYEMTIVKRKYHISLGISLIFVLFCFLKSRT